MVTSRLEKWLLPVSKVDEHVVQLPKSYPWIFMGKHCKDRRGTMLSNRLGFPQI